MKTAVGVECDQNCKWQQAIVEVGDHEENRRSSVDSAPYKGNDQDVRPTDAGYDELKDIDDQFRGLRILTNLGIQCDAVACKIEDYVDAHNETSNFGQEVQIMINNLRGE